MKPAILDIIGVEDHLPILNREQSKYFDPKYVSINNSYFMQKRDPNYDRTHFLKTVVGWDKKGVDGLIFHNFEQHLDRQELCQSLEIVSKFYDKKIMIVDEPIWNTGRHSEKATNLHENAVSIIKPDLIGYSCLYDGVKSPAKSFYWNNMVDKYAVFTEPESRENVIYGGGKEKTHRQARAPGRARPDSWKLCRDLEKRIENLSVHIRHTSGLGNHDPYREYLNKVLKGTYHYQPVCGYHFHNLRSLVAWFSGVIPIIHVPDFDCVQWKMHVDHFNIEHGKNCILVNYDDDVFESAVELMKDKKKINEILENIKCMDLSKHSTTAVSKKIWEVISE